MHVVRLVLFAVVLFAVVLFAVTVSCAGTGPTPAPTPPASPEAALASPRPVKIPGDSEPLRVLSHCTIRWTVWRGRSWVAENPQGAPTAPADANGATVNDGYTRGTITAVDPDLAVFTAPGLSEPVRFRPGPEPPGPCA